MKTKSSDASNNSKIFWAVSKDFITHQLAELQKASPHTIAAYRTGLNQFIDYQESEKNVRREDMTFSDFSRENIKSFLDWMINVRKYADKTINLRLTAIHSLLEYASSEYSIELMPIYMAASTVKCLKITAGPIEYYERNQMKALLAAPDAKTKTGRRNRMMLIMYYDTAARNSELIDASCGQLHLDAQVPFMTILGKGRKYRNIPLMEKTVEHLRCYLSEFHPQKDESAPLFYAVTYGQKHHLSSDTVESMIKKYCTECRQNGTVMPEKTICHMIRKTRAMDLYKSGMPLAHIQQLLGHESMSTTSGFYAFATLDTLAKSMKEANASGAGTKKWNDKAVLNKIYRL